MEFNYTQVYMGRPYEIDVDNAEGKIVLQVPTVGDIVDVRDDKFFTSLSPLVSNTTTYRALLWDLKLDWNKVSDYQLFTLLYKTIDPKVSEMLFGFDITKFEKYEKELDDDKTIIIYNTDLHIEINEAVYKCIHEYYQYVFNIHPENEFTDDPVLKVWWIRKDKKHQQFHKEEAKVSLQPLISALVNHAGFKYNLQQLNDVNIAFFYDSVQRLQIFEQCTAVMKGMYSGFVDSSKIPKDATNWMQDLVKNKGD